MAENRPANAPVPPARTAPAAPHDELRPDALELAMPAVAGTAKKITMFGGKVAGVAATEPTYKRPLNTTGFGACRMKSFLGKISGPGLEYMDNNINLWLDAHPEVEVKSVTSTVGPVDGKSNEHTLILNIWY